MGGLLTAPSMEMCQVASMVVTCGQYLILPAIWSASKWFDPVLHLNLETKVRFLPS